MSYILFYEEKEYDGIDFTRDLLKKTTPYKQQTRKDRDIHRICKSAQDVTVKCMKWEVPGLNWHRTFCDAGKEQL